MVIHSDSQWVCARARALHELPAIPAAGNTVICGSPSQCLQCNSLHLCFVPSHLTADTCGAHGVTAAVVHGNNAADALAKEGAGLHTAMRSGSPGSVSSLNSWMMQCGYSSVWFALAWPGSSAVLLLMPLLLQRCCVVGISFVKDWLPPHWWSALRFQTATFYRE